MPWRFNARDRDGAIAFVERTGRRRAALGLGTVNALALSGGGANGAYGAGLLVGWTQSGQRPAFDLVTGVSAGALMAPFAFLGPDGDARLRQAFTDEDMPALLGSQLQALVQPSIYGGAMLRRLVAQHVDAPLLRAVAARHAAGLILLVATTNLDTQESVIWDLGLIALMAAEEASAGGEMSNLFRQVLVASASIPGIFPPVLIIPPGGSGAAVEEMHVDGGVTAPFFVAPEALILWQPRNPQMVPGALYAVVNGTIGPSQTVTPGTFREIVWRSYETMSKAMSRAHLNASAAFAEHSRGTFRYAAIPDDVAPDALDFRPSHMRSLFELGFSSGASGEAFQGVAAGSATPLRYPEPAALQAITGKAGR